jgi:hypothetical protein
MQHSSMACTFRSFVSPILVQFYLLLNVIFDIIRSRQIWLWARHCQLRHLSSPRNTRCTGERPTIPIRLRRCEAVGDADVDAGATSTSADGGLDAGGHGHGSKNKKEKDAPNIMRERGKVEWRASNRRRISIPIARRTSMARLGRRDGTTSASTTSVNGCGKVNQQFRLSSAATCAAPEVPYFDIIEFGLFSSSSNGTLFGFASPASNVSTAAIPAESRETKKVVIKPTSCSRPSFLSR